MKKSLKEKIRHIIVGSIVGVSIGSIVPQFISSYQEHQEQLAAIEKQIEENNKIMDSLMQDTSAEVSESATSIINNISNISDDNDSMENLEITKGQIINTYKLYNEENHHHQYQSLYIV